MYRNSRGTGNRPSTGWSNGFQGSNRHGPIYNTGGKPVFPVPVDSIDDLPPSFKQLKFVEDISVSLSVSIPIECKTSRRWAKAFLDFYRPKLEAQLQAKRVLREEI